MPKSPRAKVKNPCIDDVLDAIQTQSDFKTAVLKARENDKPATVALFKLLEMEHYDWRWPNFAWKITALEYDVQIIHGFDRGPVVTITARAGYVTLCWLEDRQVWTLTDIRRALTGRYHNIVDVNLIGDAGRAKLRFALWTLS